MTALLYLIFALVMVLACALGIVGGYYYYRARHRESLEEMKALDQQLSEREHELRRQQFQLPAGSRSSDHAPADELLLQVQQLQDALEQRNVDLSILQQEYEQENRLLRDELEAVRTRRASDDDRRASDDEEAGEPQHPAEVDALRAELEEERQQLQAARAALEEERAALARQAQEPQAAGADARLVKRLRQQIRLQEEEMAQLRRLLGRADGRADRAPAPEGPPAPERDPAAPLPSFSPLSTLLNTAGPASCDALTQLSGVDETVQAHLYEHGVTRFEQIARWSSADVRRISESLGIDRRLIQDRWIIEAQSYLYERNHSL